MSSRTPSKLGEQDPAWSIPSLRDSRYSQSLERGLAILNCFTPENPVLGIGDLSRLLDLSPSTTHRYVVTLVALGYLEKRPKRKYQLGLRVTDLGMSALNGTGLREHAHSFLEELRQRTSFTASIAVLDGTEIVYVDRIASFRRDQQRKLTVHTSSRLPAHATAAGKLLIANLPDDVRRELLAEVKLRKQGPNTIRSKRALREELQTIKETGIAFENEELAPGLHAVAVGVRNEREVVAAVDLVADTSTISPEDLRDGLSAHLISTADRISARLGYRITTTAGAS
jgi:IclR family pca regulon transcriptional regulator